MELFLLYIIPIVLVLGAQALVTGTYKKYKLIENHKGLTGSAVARKILDINNLSNINVVETKGTMSDHYDPKNKVIKLSSGVYNDNSIASISIAAHECGHAIQHKEKYLFMLIRSFLVPFVNFTSKIGYIVLIIGFIASVGNIVLIGIILLSATLLFQLVTLPVEFNASNRANKILKNEQMIDADEEIKVKAMLGAAAMTYVASLLANLLEILRLALMFNRSRD
ncbi:MAG: zinc metallopeptidase [Bacilli bacterium]|nr:zinc metallopeptidase [Bacilli bacterium]